VTGNPRERQVTARVIDVAGLDALIRALADDGREVLGPVRRDGAIVYDTIGGADDLPRGWIDHQGPGHYRLEQQGDAFFDHVVGPSSWKRVLHPPRQALWRSRRDGDATTIEPQPLPEGRYALVGVRGCELQAILVQDRVFLEGPYRDPHYAARRAATLIVAVNCGRAGGTCFCASMGTGPKAGPGHDLALTEIEAGAAFLAEAASAAGAALLARLPARNATAADHAAADAATARAASMMGRSLDTNGLAALLQARPDHPRWTEVAARCLNCANCTMACPTCFCTAMEEGSAVDGSHTTRTARWDSCFTSDFSHIHGGAVRPSAKSRYRQWLTHKLSTWHDQFQMAGCVGCGRCITWCPVGIDITEEAAAIRG